MYYLNCTVNCKEIGKKGVLLHEYSQTAIIHAPYFRRVVKIYASSLEPLDSSSLPQIPQALYF